MNKHVWNELLTEIAAEMYQKGTSCKEIGKTFGYHENTVYTHLKKAGVIKSVRANLTEDEERKICELYDQGLVNVEIAKRFDIDASHVSVVAKRNGCKMRGKGTDVEKMRNAAKRGHATQSAISDKYMRQYVTKSTDGQVSAVSRFDGRTWTLRCNVCGAKFERYLKRGHSINCPSCQERKAEQERAERKRKQYERQQQLEAAREWRLSVPRICKECGDPFYSECETAVFCCDACRKKASYRRKKRRGGNVYKRRMRIAITKDTYDRTISLDKVYKKYRGRCRKCGCKTVRTKKYSPQQATLDHIIALANNGTHTWDNVQLLCSDCNSKKRDLGQMRLEV